MEYKKVNEKTTFETFDFITPIVKICIIKLITLLENVLNKLANGLDTVI